MYAIGAICLIALLPRSSKTWHLLPDWIAAPSQLLATASAAIVVWKCRGTPWRTTWIWVLGFCAMNLAASYIWNEWRVIGRVPALSLPDVCYFVDYALLTTAYGVAFARFGGSFRDSRTWLDAVTIVVALLGTFWGALLGTFLPRTHAPHVNVPYALSYAISLATWMAMATLMFLRMPALRPVPALLIGAGLIDAIWEVGWLATWLTDRNYVTVYYNFGDVLCCTLIACAAGAAKNNPENETLTDGAERSAYAFVPALLALLAIALVGACLASTRAPDAWIVVGLVILAVLLLVTRQGAARRELAELNRAFTLQVADARLTELVRQSADAFLVIDARGLVAFASPATATTVGVSPSMAIGKSAASLFGTAHQATLDRFLRQLITAPAPTASLELPIEAPGLPPRILKLHGANRIANIHIDGLTLTISDISDQRALERDVLTAANHERLRLAGDIHDGLGQELSGILLMLQSLTKSPDLGAPEQQVVLRTIVGHVAEAIRGTRDLARGVSPIYVVRGSLRDALQRLGRDIGNQAQVHVEVDPLLDDLVIDELPADHLYRIAREAVQNSVHHGSCSRIDVRLQVLGDSLLLEVADDGVGFGSHVVKDSGFGLRLMEYRARVIGATFEIAPRPDRGTLARVAVRLWTVARKSAAEIAR